MAKAASGLALLAALAVSLGGCAHGARDRGPAGKSVTTYMYEVEFLFDDKPLKIMRPAYCGVDIICPRYKQGQAPPPKPHPGIPVRSFPQGRNDHALKIVPKRNRDGGQLTVRIRLTNDRDALKKWYFRGIPGDNEKELEEYVERILEEPAEYLTRVPKFPVGVTLLVGKQDPQFMAECQDYYYRKKTLGEQQGNDPTFKFEELNEDIQAYYNAPPPEGCGAAALKLNKWVEFTQDFAKDSPPTRIQLLTPHSDLLLAKF